MAGDYTIGNLYQEESSYFKPGRDSPYLGKESLIPTRQMGMTTDPRTANQLAALSTALNQGVVPVEIGQISPQVFETIPKQHFEEMRRKAKLAGAQLTLHAPIQGMDPSGMGERGWDESQQQAVERQLFDVMEKAAVMDEKGNLPVTIHGSNAAGSTFKMVQGKKVYDQLVAIDRATGQLAPAKEEIKYYPGGEMGKIITKEYTPEEQLVAMNNTTWDDTLTKVEFQRENADKILNNVNPLFQGRFIDIFQGHTKMEELNQGEYVEFKKVISAKAHIDEAEREMRVAFSKAYKFAEEDHNKNELDYLKKLSKNYSAQLGYKDGKPTILSQNPATQSEAIFNMIQGLKPLQPKLFQTVEEFSINKASDTFANVAMHSYGLKGEKAPAISIENLYQGMGFSQGEDLKNLVESSQSKFVKQLIKEKGLKESKAQQVAQKLIGVTFDVGHLNVSRKHGFETEDLVKEAKEVAKFVNKVHITDNFGFNDSHLPIGMGNVPVKELLEALGEQGAKSVKINEVGGWFEHFKTSPFPQLLEAAGSSIYSTGSGPYWSQAGGFQQSYMEGYGQMLPSTHYQLFGAGFSQLPQELGGQTGQSGGGRMGGGGF